MADPVSEHDLVRAFAGANADYYASAFGRIRGRSGFTWSFNPAAGLLGPLFGLPDALADASPFALAPSAPADAVTVAPLLALTAATIAAGALGLAAFRRRDLAP